MHWLSDRWITNRRTTQTKSMRMNWDKDKNTLNKWTEMRFIENSVYHFKITTALLGSYHRHVNRNCLNFKLILFHIWLVCIHLHFMKKRKKLKWIERSSQPSAREQCDESIFSMLLIYINYTFRGFATGPAGAQLLFIYEIKHRLDLKSAMFHSILFSFFFQKIYFMFPI